MPLLIDGYNLLYASGILKRGHGPGKLRRGREALLHVLAESLDEDERDAAVVVFDAKDAPADREATAVRRGITVHFAVDHEEADDLIEMFIARESAPKQLTVVSSDRRIQTVARRRKAAVAESLAWWEELLGRRAARIRSSAHDSQGANEASDAVVEIDPQELEYWLAEFTRTADADHEATKADPAAKASRSDSNAMKADRTEHDPTDPFPPDYFDDLPAEL